MDADMRQALVERSRLLEQRAGAELDEALLAGETWTRALGATPLGPIVARWRRHAGTVAAYRDRYRIVGAIALGPAPVSTAQRLDAGRARAALEAAQRLANGYLADTAPGTAFTPGLPSGIRRF
jgi:hypothetical protein